MSFVYNVSERFKVRRVKKKDFSKDLIFRYIVCTDITHSSLLSENKFGKISTANRKCGGRKEEARGRRGREEGKQSEFAPRCFFKQK